MSSHRFSEPKETELFDDEHIRFIDRGTLGGKLLFKGARVEGIGLAKLVEGLCGGHFE
jgi:hypothetical protein